MKKIEFLEENYDDFISKTIQIGKGTEADVLLLDNIIYKIFNSQVHMHRNKRRIRKLSEMKELDEYITLPQDELYLDFKYIGYTMEYGGENLISFLKKNKLTNKEKLEILYKIKNAIEALHSKDMIHGDIHATNILVDENGNVKLTDLNNVIFKNTYTGYLNRLSKEFLPILGISKKLDIICYNYMAYIIMCAKEEYYYNYLDLKNETFKNITNLHTLNTNFNDEYIRLQNRILTDPKITDKSKIDYITNHLK